MRDTFYIIGTLMHNTIYPHAFVDDTYFNVYIKKKYHFNQFLIHN